MTKEQMIKVMEYFQAAYKGFYEGRDVRSVLPIWYEMFADKDPRIVSAAAKAYVRSHKFPPTIAELQEQIDLIMTKETDTDLWALIYKAASNGTYNSEEEFAKLPPECQSFVGSPSALKDLAQTDPGTMNTVVKGQFLKRIQAIKEHKAVQSGLPAEVRLAIEESKTRAMLEGGAI